MPGTVLITFDILSHFILKKKGSYFYHLHPKDRSFWLWTLDPFYNTRVLSLWTRRFWFHLLLCSQAKRSHLVGFPLGLPIVTGDLHVWPTNDMSQLCQLHVAHIILSSRLQVKIPGKDGHVCKGGIDKFFWVQSMRSLQIYWDTENYFKGREIRITLLSSIYWCIQTYPYFSLIKQTFLVHTCARPGQALRMQRWKRQV